MSTKAQITTAIDAKIRNKTPLVVKVEHADVEQLITDEMFPASVVVEWDGTAPVLPTTDIVCSGSLSSADNVKFKVYFWKQGNTVYYNGFVENLSSSSALQDLYLIEFATTLYKPLAISRSKAVLIDTYNALSKQIIFVWDTGLYITAGLPAQFGVTRTYSFNGSYKVAN
jgi:hypothetical protein